MPMDSLHEASARAAEPPRFVRLLRERSDGFVEFVFSIDDPGMGVDLILPRVAFHEFCEHNRVQFVDEHQAACLDFDAQKWRFGVPGLTE